MIASALFVLPALGPLFIAAIVVVAVLVFVLLVLTAR